MKTEKQIKRKLEDLIKESKDLQGKDDTTEVEAQIEILQWTLDLK